MQGLKNNKIIQWLRLNTELFTLFIVYNYKYQNIKTYLTFSMWKLLFFVSLL